MDFHKVVYSMWWLTHHAWFCMCETFRGDWHMMLYMHLWYPSFDTFLWRCIWYHYDLHYRDVTWALWYLKPPATLLLVHQLVQANSKENIKAPHYWTFVTHKEPVMRKAFPCHDVITWLILGLRPANERRHYFVTTCLIGWGKLRILLLHTFFLSLTARQTAYGKTVHWWNFDVLLLERRCTVYIFKFYCRAFIHKVANIKSLRCEIASKTFISLWNLIGW